MPNFKQSLALQKKMNALIPGGSHTYAKGDDQYPEFMPPYIVKGKGCQVWDIDGNEFIEYGMGLRSISLGHAYPAVNHAAFQQMELGNNFTRPGFIEYEAAEAFLSLFPKAEMVKFAKNGSDATSGAIRLARAYTKRNLIAICGNHPFFSFDDWFMGSTAINAGIPKAIQELTVKFKFNDIESVRKLFRQHDGQLACLIMEAERTDPVDLNFLNETIDLCKQNGTVFILDEMITGFRWSIGGAQTYYDIDPDLSTFGKALGNGFAIAALTGKREIMELGGLHHDKERVFLMSATHGAEHHALAAMMAVIREYKEKPIIQTLKTQGERLANGINNSIKYYSLENYFCILGHPACLVFGTRDQDGQPSQPYRTLFLQELLKRGVIAPNLVISYAHTNEIVDQTIEVFHAALAVYKKAIQEGVENYLDGRSVAPVYRKRNYLKK